MNATKSVSVKGSPSRCPYCHDQVSETDIVAVCESCLSRHHSECWDEGGRCGSCRSEVRLQRSSESGSGVRVAVAPKPEVVCDVSVDCARCGVQGEEGLLCRVCDTPTCRGCVHERLPTCLDCGAELSRKQERARQLTEEIDDAEGYIALIGCGAFLGGCLGLGGLAWWNLGAATAGAAALVGLLLIGALVKLPLTRRRKEKDEIDVALAPFQGILPQPPKAS